VDYCFAKVVLAVMVEILCVAQQSVWACRLRFLYILSIVRTAG